MYHLCSFSTSSVKEIQCACNINTYIKSFYPCKGSIIQIPIKTSLGCILINNYFFIIFITITYKTNEVIVLIFPKNLDLTQELLFPLTKPDIQSLCNNDFKSVTIMKVSFKDFPKSSSANTIVIMEVLCGMFYVYK
ncbi:hypothetical protein HanPSC8_Chr10g0425331 [Helianthus annuus]|nr:hypothetical protein HanPSC8_Chr10g0425331 [Helianthus annuus]